MRGEQPDDVHRAGYKVLGMETEPVRAKIRAFWNLVRRQVTGAPSPRRVF